MSVPTFVAMGFSIAWIIVVIMAHCRLDRRPIIEREPRPTRNRRGRRTATLLAINGILK